MTDRIKALEDALRKISELNETGADENGHRWANSDLIEQEIVFALAASQPAQGEAATWCQPMDCGKHTPRVWLIRFEDQSVGDLTFDNEAEARRMWEKYNHDWNCYLMASLPLLAASQPAQPVAWVEKQELEYLRMVTCNKGWSGYQRAIMVGGEKEGCAPLYAAPHPLTVQDAVRVPEIAALIEAATAAKQHIRGALGFTLNAALRAIAEGQQ